MYLLEWGPVKTSVPIGWLLGFSEGLTVGIDDGMCVGASVGVNVGNIVGALVCIILNQVNRPFKVPICSAE